MSPLAFDRHGPRIVADLGALPDGVTLHPLEQLPATGLDDATGEPYAPALPVQGPAGLPLVPALPDALRLDGPATDLHRELRSIIERAILEHPRSLQTRIGPSEVGTPCTRRLAYKLGELPEVNVRAAAWRPTVGTAVHAWVADQLALDNVRRGYTRWLLEARVSPGEIDGEPLTGNSDVYDRATGDVLDWKIPGITTVREARRNGPSVEYRVQGHLYGRGFRRRGLPVRNVNIAFLPAAGELSDGVWWSEPYSEQVALDALDRASAIARAGKAIGFAKVGALSAAVDAHCTYCPFYAPADPDPAAGRCPGAPGLTQAEPAPAARPTSTDPFGLAGMLPAGQ